MKKIILVLLFLLPLLVKAQYPTSYAGVPPYQVYIYLGTLPVDNGYNYHKIKAEVLGGGYFGTSLGETVFYIANRGGGLQVNKVSLGSNYTDNYILKAYNRTDGTVDCYLYTNNYVAVAVKSFMLGGGPNLITNTITTATPSGTEITPLPIKSNLVTDVNGNIGIGTESPLEKLSVNGRIRAKEVKVETNPATWPDYVFEDGYKIRTLQELEGYIKTNKHLPEMPTAKEVEANGVELGEMNRLLLKKVEELTLLLIEQNKKLMAQGEEIKKIREGSPRVRKSER
ncbi:hypothetical protein EZ428_21600 [Pedobacter frigiditerrae]|uniref:Uncharacterized protein n=1 Tax=Pedobacter frigiditerrae TaxID=2530452 RepID=A0A4R0MKW2_9SPHI|nr:hypothetical protein [Pedobacter frigiditerrae]TCC87299.1 hypothetical protein EZ428_21600 [Pedobacter frigiditerrae]